MRPGRLLFTPCLAVAALVGLNGMLVNDATAADDGPVVIVFDTSAGPITVELDRAKAPITVDNFLKYVDSGYFNNLVFHRVIPGFMIQGGGFEDRGTSIRQKFDGLLDPIKNEAGNGLSNKRGTIAMARTGDPNSATCQFFINLVDNGRLDRNEESAGYAVFGKVVGEGMEAVDKIARVPTVTKPDERGQLSENVPAKPVVIRSAKRKGKS